MKQLRIDWTGNIPGSGEARVDGYYAVSTPRLNGYIYDVPRKIVGWIDTLILVNRPTADAQIARHLRVAPTGDRFAYLGQDDGIIWEWIAELREANGIIEWTEGAWHNRGPSYGPCAVIYDRAGELHIIDTKEQYQATGGYRCVAADGSLVSFKDTFEDKSRGLYEYTDFGDVAIGQGSVSGVAIRFADESQNRVLVLDELRADDDVHEIHVQRDGDRFAIAACLYTRHCTILTWGSLDELRAMPTVLDMPRIGRPLWLAWLTFGAPEIAPPANADLRVDADMLVRALDGRVIAQYVAAEADGTYAGLEAAIAAARVKRPGVPVLAYWPWKLQGGPIPTSEYVGIEAYRPNDVPLATFSQRLYDLAQRCPRPWLIAQCYTSNEYNTKDLLSLVPVYARLCQTLPSIVGIAAFSGSGRKTGYQDHPEVWDAWRTLFAGITGAPTIADPVPAGPVDLPPAPSEHPAPATPPSTPPVAAPLTPPEPSPFLTHAHPFGGLMEIFLKVAGKYTGVDPHPITSRIDEHGRRVPVSGDAQFPVYRNRDEGRGWERVLLSKHDDGSYDGVYIAADRQLSINDQGGLESRKAGAIGPNEQLWARTQPEQTDDHGILYRLNADGEIIGTPLQIEAAS
jgi:hypothetical protein